MARVYHKPHSTQGAKRRAPAPFYASDSVWRGISTRTLTVSLPEPQPQGHRQNTQRRPDQRAHIHGFPSGRQCKPEHREVYLDSSHVFRNAAMAERKSGWDRARALIRAPSAMPSSKE